MCTLFVTTSSPCRVCLLYGETHVPVAWRDACACCMACRVCLLYGETHVPVAWRDACACCMACRVCLLYGETHVPVAWRDACACCMACRMCLLYGVSRVPVVWRVACACCMVWRTQFPSVRTHVVMVVRGGGGVMHFYQFFKRLISILVFLASFNRSSYVG